MLQARGGDEVSIVLRVCSAEAFGDRHDSLSRRKGVSASRSSHSFFAGWPVMVELAPVGSNDWRKHRRCMKALVSWVIVLGIPLFVIWRLLKRRWQRRPGTSETVSSPVVPCRAKRMRVVVIGAGAAGLVAAAEAAKRSASVLLLEKNGKTGVKILMSGGTRCNLTHDTRCAGSRTLSGMPSGSCSRVLRASRRQP